ncbi:L-threonylcarbamoyladenylate synthase [Spirochaeta isovalerica]|uniref:tRNA threonylcarbamoyl adenosine modification protein (Sua5/YciO/YrdC/YwlC family) n=1 Tax=Spirochaeta isovalerica TaxID=150 RepID=A0A841R771_9SPIO|nr:L-threonylcarbamoyladenylate synthase [Spirochaeta isovalerica]MBB6479685.1 tRNA threonylcarbamoyl adenosine modification protein (Sua5/YciO/YrdC/YwlC family) [Spirochaeta isovalerica]
MIEYVQPHDPDDRIIKKAVSILEEGGIIAYPTDSSWGIGCSSESAKGLEKLSRLREDKKTQFSLICSSISQMSTVANIDNQSFRIIKQNTPGPFVFVLKAIRKVEKMIGEKRAEVGLRIPAHEIPKRLVDVLGAPLFSITASKDMMDVYGLDAEYPEENLLECGWELENIRGIDLIIDSGEALEKSLSTVLRLDGGVVEVLRYGDGKLEE